MDNLLSAISAKASYLEDRKGEKHSSMIFTGLCRIFGTLLTILRTKIGGRYHLVLCALQALLRCLFVPFTTTNSSHETSSTFTETHAAAYARVLTTLCDPTVSSVTRSKHRFTTRIERRNEKGERYCWTASFLPYNGVLPLPVERKAVTRNEDGFESRPVCCGSGHVSRGHEDYKRGNG